MRSNSYDLSSGSSSSSRKTSIFFPTGPRHNSTPLPGTPSCGMASSSGYNSVNSSVSSHVSTPTFGHDVRATSLSSIWEWPGSNPGLTDFSGDSSWSEKLDDDYDMGALARGLEELDFELSKDLDLNWNIHSERLAHIPNFIFEEDPIDPKSTEEELNTIEDESEQRESGFDRSKIVLKLPKVTVDYDALPPINIMKYHEVFSSTFYRRNAHGYMFIKEANDELLKTENNAISVGLKMGAKSRKVLISVNKMSRYEMFNDFKVVKKKGSNVSKRFGK